MSASLHPDQPLPELESSALLQPEATHFRSGPFQVGGTLRVDDATYIQRQADEDLFQCLRRGDLCYVFNSRQMGKSSLMVRVKYRLSQAGCRCMALDLTSIGTEDITAGQWYKGLCAQLWLGFELGAYSQFRAWWSSHQGEAYLLKLAICLRLVLQAYPLQPIVILVDEIDSVLALNFGVDDFFALIRYAYNQRAVEADFQRLTFALFGVATPSDLIRDRTRTPFNIGHALSLEGFSLAEAQPLAAVLGLPPDLAQAILAAILHWTAGQPFLTQKLCRLVWQQSQSPASLNLDSESALDWVSQLVRQRLIHHWATQDDPEHLRTIRDRLLRDPNQTGGILALYQRILAAEGEPAPAVLAASPDLADLLLSGLVVYRQGTLAVKNRLYREVFNPAWVAEQLANLRPYASMFNAWIASNRQDDSQLLRGQALERARQWARGKRLTEEDLEFLAASETLDRQILETSLELAKAREVEAKLLQERQVGQLQKRLLGVLSLALLVSLGLGGLAFWQFRRALSAQVQTQQETIRALAASSQAQFIANRRLEALVDAIQAEERLRKLPRQPPLPQEIRLATDFALRQAVYGAEERNQLIGHSDNVNGVAISPDGQRMVSVSADNQFKIWQVTGALVDTIEVQGTELYAVAYDPRGEHIAVAGGGGYGALWTPAGQRLATLTGHSVAVWSITYSADGEFLLTASQDGTVKRWNRQGQLLDTLNAHQAPVYGVAVRADGQLLATASTDGTAKLWDRQGRLLSTLAGHQGPVWAVAFAPDGSWLVTAGDDQTLKLWRADGTLLRTLEGHQGPIWGVRVSPDGAFLVSTSVDQTVRVWRPNGTLIKTLRGHTGNVWGVDISPDNRTIATASWDNSLRLWQTTHPLVQRLDTGGDYITQVVFDSTGNRLVSASLGGQIRLWNRQGDLLRTLGSHGVEAWAVAVSPDGQYVASGSADNTVKLWSLEGKLLHTLRGHPDAVYGVTISPDGNLIASTSLSGTLNLWNRQGKLLHTRQVGQNSTAAPQFSSDGTRLAAIGETSLQLWSLQGEQLHPLGRLEVGRVLNLAFSPDGQTLATVNNQMLRLWNLEGQLLKTVTPDLQEADFISTVAFSPDGRRLATVIWQQNVGAWQVKLIDLETGQVLRVLPGHQGRVRHISFSADGSQLLTGSFDRTLALWNLPQSLTVDYLTFACQWAQDYLANRPPPTPFDVTLCQR